MTLPARADDPQQSGACPSQPQRGRYETRQRILIAALELFGRDGFENTTVRAIARRCGLTDAALYYYFRSKREILDALWDIPLYRKMRDADHNKPLTVEYLLQLVDEMMLASANMDPIVRLMFRQALSGDQDAVDFRRRTMAAWRKEMCAHFLTVLPPEEAEFNTDLLTLLIMATMFMAQVQLKDDYGEYARSEDFRAQVGRMVLLSLPFCRQRQA